MYFIFRFITGFCGSAFLSVAGGSVSDLFSNESVAKYVFSPLSVKMVDQHLFIKSYGAIHNKSLHRPCFWALDKWVRSPVLVLLENSLIYC